MQLNGKTVVVTGGAAGIGGEISEVAAWPTSRIASCIGTGRNRIVRHRVAVPV